jgi:hypothetical protein
LLALLNDPPPAKERHLSRNWKRRFHKLHLGTDREAEIVAKWRSRCPALFPKTLLERARARHSPLDEVLVFLGV